MKENIFFHPLADLFDQSFESEVSSQKLFKSYIIHIIMWGCISQLDLPYAVRHRMRFRERYEPLPPLTPAQIEIVKRLRGEDVEVLESIKPRKKFKCEHSKMKAKFESRIETRRRLSQANHVKVPNLKILNEYPELSAGERRRLINEAWGIKGPQKREPGEPQKPRLSYLDLIRTRGLPLRAVKAKSRIGGKKREKSEYRSYADARKDRQAFRKKLVEVIMHRDEWDDENEEPASPSAPLTTTSELRLNGLFRSLSVQMTGCLQTLCLNSIYDYEKFIDSLDEGTCGTGFVINLKVVANKVIFYPSFEDLENSLLEAYSDMINACHDIPHLQMDKQGKQRLLKPIILPEVIDPLREKLHRMIHKHKQKPADHVNLYAEYLYLIDGSAEKQIDEYISGGDRNFFELSEKVIFFDGLANKLATNMAKEENVGFFEIRCQDLISSIQRKILIIRDKLLKQMTSNHVSENKKLCEEFEAISNKALSTPNNTEELVLLKETVENIQRVVMFEKEEKLRQTAKRLIFLSDYLQFTTSEMKLNTRTFQLHAHMPEVFKEHSVIISEKTIQYQKALKLRRERFIEELEASNQQVDEFLAYGVVDELHKYSKKAQLLNTKLELYKEKIEQFNMEETAFDWELTTYPMMKITIDKLSPFLRLYETSMEFMNKQKIWYESPMGTHDPKDIDAEVDSSIKLVSHLEIEFVEIPIVRNLVLNVKERIEEFQDKMPIIRTLGNPGFRERHWENVSNTVGFPVKGGEDTNLFKILDMGLDEYVSKFEKISEAATKEYNLEKSMLNMVDEWSDMEFTITSYGETGTYTLQSMDNIQVLLDDHIVKTQTMRGSPFIKPFEEQIAKWEIKLLLLQEIMDEWLKVQDVWLYLEPIFGSPDIMAQMPEEGRRFTTVDKNWRDIMKAAIVDKHVLAVVQIERILEKLKKSNELLDLIGKGLNDYLERKRQCFPRFFFLSNSELLEILSETKNPQRVCPHLKKCFDGISNLLFDSDMEVIHMCSSSGESIALVKSISTMKARGQVDKWLCELEVQMIDSLRREMKNALEKCDGLSTMEALVCFPSQALQCVRYITWTKKIENAILEDGSLAELMNINNEEINMLKDMILIENDVYKCRTISSTIILHGYFKDIIKYLDQHNISSLDDFAWSSRLRYYWKNNTIELNMLRSTQHYGYEYINSYNRLVMTPLTERCFRVLLMALDLHLGGHVAGETATGKTETVKDLSRCMGKLCWNFNCSEDLHYKAFAKFLKGVVSCGAWGCFDEFHRIDVQILSIIAQQILNINNSINSGSGSMSLDGSDIKINTNCAIFVTTDSLQEICGLIPDNLLALFRPVTMINPDMAIIAEQTMMSQGFQESNVLAQKLASMVELCDGLLSTQPHYEFGVRSVISILRSAGAIKKATNRSDDEHYIISKALHIVKYSELLPQDQAMFRDILVKTFYKCPPDPIPDDLLKKAIEEQCVKNNLEGTPHFLSKVQQLFDMMDLTEGVMLLGGSFGGKTQAWKILANALKTAGGDDRKAPCCVIVNPKAVRIDQLFGYFDNNEWKDGILAKNFRQFAALPEKDRKWLIFDGPIDSEWIENMNTVLDENKKLCLMSGEIIPLPSNTNLIFEANDVESVSPGTISRCGILYMDPECLDWNLMVKNWIKTFPTFIPDEIKQELMKMFVRFCPTLLSVSKRYSCIWVTDHHLINSLINLFDCYLQNLISGSHLKGRSTLELQPLFEGMFFFSLIWSFGAVCTTEGKEKFNGIFGQLMRDDVDLSSLNIPPLDTPYVFPLPSDLDVFSYKLVMATKPSWKTWEESMNQSIALPRFVLPRHLIIPTKETEKYYFLLNLFANNAKNILLIGASGTGKSVYINDVLDNQLDTEIFSHVKLYFTSTTSASSTQDIIMSKLDKRRKGVYGPSLGKKFIVFVDDVNMPQKDSADAQSSLELLRQLMDHRVWYDTKELSPMKLIDIKLMAAMRPPQGTHQSPSNRFVRHFNVVTADLFTDQTILNIFSRIVLWHLDNKGFSKEFDPCIGQIVGAALDMHKFVLTHFLPTPDHSHYLFSIKEISRTICGVLLSVPETMENLDTMKRIWIHETQRVYYDRLVNPKDCNLFVKAISDICSNRLGVSLSKLLGKDEIDDSSQENHLQKLMFCDFNDFTNEERFYREIINWREFRDITNQYLRKYNEVSRKPMDLVLFDYANEHLCRISRLLKQPENHVLLVGMGGIGRQSLARIATYIAGYEFHQIDMGREDGLTEWRCQIKEIIKLFSISLTPNVIFLYDAQILHDYCYEDINNLLFSGEVPNLFVMDEKHEIIENMKVLEKKLDKTEHTDGSGPALFSLFVKKTKENLHFIMAMNPLSDRFKDEIAMFPSLLNCCSINWMHKWPNSALSFVSHQKLVGIGLEDDELDRCIKLCEYIHMSTIKLSKQVENVHGIHNYVTPASFLELNTLFKTLLLEKKVEILDEKQKYVVSLEKLGGAESQVVIMQEDMLSIQPNLSEASRDVDNTMLLQEKEQFEVSELEKVVKGEDLIVNEKKKIADNIRNECDVEIGEINLIIDAAIEEVASLTQSEIAATRGVKVPSSSVKLVLEAICVYKGIKPDRIPDATGSSKMYDDYWGPSKRLLSDPKFVETLSNFDKDNISPRISKIIREKYLGNPEMNPDKSKSAIPAMDIVAKALYRWLMAIDSYEKIMRNLLPKKDLLANAESEYQDTLEAINEKKKTLKEAQEKLKDVHQDLQRRKQRKAELENEVELCSRKLERAEQLISSFGGERERWSAIRDGLSQDLKKLVGNVLLSAGFVAYLGAFPAKERMFQIEAWKEEAKKLGILVSENYSLEKTFGNPITIQSWYINGLLDDRQSTDNGIILSVANRWSLMVDPQDMGNRWIKNMEKQNNLTAIKLSDTDFIRSLENCVQTGIPVVLENVSESLDPVLEPLLQKQTFLQGGSLCIKLGESTIEYNKDFKMYLTTRMKNPNFPPEVTAKLSLINFTITEAGVKNQLLSIMVARERPELEEENCQVMIQLNENKKSIQDIENKILQVLFNSKGNILEDENAIKTLSSSKVMANEIIEKQSLLQATQKRIQTNRLEYMPTVEYATILFFTISKLSNVNVMYQYSLNWFLNIFCSSIDSAEKCEELKNRLKNVERHFLNSIFIHTSRGLFEGDKILFSFLLACAIGSEKNIYELPLFDVFLNFENLQKFQDDSLQPLILSWIDAQSLVMFNNLTKNVTFSEARNCIVKDLRWKNLWLSKFPESEDIDYLRKLSPFQKLLLLSSLRPDKIVPIVRKFVVETLGASFVEQEAFDIARSYKDSTCGSPIIFILEGGVDPCRYILGFAEELGFVGKKFCKISLGKGQEESAREAIKECSQSGCWVLLMNCHLLPEWMPELEYICDDLRSETTNPDFRLWLTSMPTEHFPIPTLQIGIKIALEEPTSVKANLVRHLASKKSFIVKYDANGPIYQKMAFALALFHAALNQRRTYVQCGWNHEYVFGDMDFEMCLRHLESIQSGSALYSHTTLLYLISVCTYGGKMEDEFDQRTLETFLDAICSPNLVLDETSFAFDADNLYNVESIKGSVQLFEYLSKLPTDVTPDLMRMNRANHWCKNEVMGKKFLFSLRKAQKVSNFISDEIGIHNMRDSVIATLKRIPELFVIGGNPDKIITLILEQELQKYNKLLERMKVSLENTIKGIDGEHMVTRDIEDLLRSLKEGEVPSIWLEVSYPTLEDMEGFLDDLNERITFLREWQHHGLPSIIWMTALYEPGDFLIAILYLESLKCDTTAFHELSLKCAFASGPDASTYDFEAEKRAGGVVIRGLYLVGASWDVERNILAEADRQSVFTEMPLMALIPILSEDDTEDCADSYRCPVFQNSQRSGDDNYVIDLDLPTTEFSSDHWVLRGTALICQRPIT